MSEPAPQEGQANRHSFKPYPVYKDPGVEWLGEIPSSWECPRLRFVARLNPVKSEVRHLDPQLRVSFVPMEAVGENGGLGLDVVKPIAQCLEGYTYFRDGDVVIAKITPCFENGKGALAAGLENGVAFGTTELHVLRAKPGLYVPFLFCLTLSDHFRRLGAAAMYGAGGQKRVPEDFIRDFRHPLPSEPEQRAIAIFLDRETARIDALVAKKERLIALLQEERTALITRAVTKGLDPNVPMKASGVEWLGEIPAHWEMRRIRHVVRRIEQGWSPDCENREADEEEWGVLKAGCVNRGVFIESEHKALPAKLEPIPELEIGPGDLLMSRASGSRELVGSVAVVPKCRPRLLLCDKVFRLHVDAETSSPQFLGYAMNSRIARWQIEGVLSGGSGLANNIAQEVVKDLILAQPATDEQHAIGAFLDRETARIDALVAKVGDASESLKELRTALISAAVTGKIDVREEATA